MAFITHLLAFIAGGSMGFMVAGLIFVGGGDLDEPGELEEG